MVMWKNIVDSCIVHCRHSNFPVARQQQVHAEELSELQQCKQEELANLRMKDDMKTKVRSNRLRCQPPVGVLNHTADIGTGARDIS